MTRIPFNSIDGALYAKANIATGRPLGAFSLLLEHTTEIDLTEVGSVARRRCSHAAFEWFADEVNVADLRTDTDPGAKLQPKEAIWFASRCKFRHPVLIAGLAPKQCHCFELN